MLYLHITICSNVQNSGHVALQHVKSLTLQHSSSDTSTDFEASSTGTIRLLARRGTVFTGPKRRCKSAKTASHLQGRCPLLSALIEVPVAFCFSTSFNKSESQNSK
jgi:hypothetical protein